VLTNQRVRARLEHFELADDPVAAGIQPGATASTPDRVPTHPHRIGALERLDGRVTRITERGVSRPWGLAGGEPGMTGENWLLPGGDESRAEGLLDKCTVHLHAGDVVRILTPGGGGWGKPSRAGDGS
jgi:hypothetical protein